MKKNKEIKPDWDLIQNRMLKIVEEALKDRWKTYVMLSIYEFSKKLPIKNESMYDGFVGFFPLKNNTYIDCIVLRKHKSKKRRVFILAHELGHILDYLQCGAIDSSNYKNLTPIEKLKLFEMEKRAFHNGYVLLKRVGLSSIYLERYVIERSLCLSRLVYYIENVNFCKNSKKIRFLK